MIKVRWRTDLKNLDRLERRVPNAVSDSVKDAAQALKDDMQSHWSASSPSAPGHAPAEDSGNLNDSIFVEESGRNALGRFATGENAITWTVRIDTTEGLGYSGGGGYEGYLEGGTRRMEPRPFVRPAVERLRGTYSQFFAHIFS